MLNTRFARSCERNLTQLGHEIELFMHVKGVQGVASPGLVESESIAEGPMQMPNPPIGSSSSPLRCPAAPLSHSFLVTLVTLVTYLLTHSKMSSTRFNVRRWRRLSFILLLFINLCAISILYPHLFNGQVPRRWDWRLFGSHSLHRLQSDGRLEVNMEGRHPVLELMALGEAKWARMIHRYSPFPSQLLQFKAVNTLSPGKARLFRKQSLNIAGVIDGTHLGGLTAGNFEANAPPFQLHVR